MSLLYSKVILFSSLHIIIIAQYIQTLKFNTHNMKSDTATFNCRTDKDVLEELTLLWKIPASCISLKYTQHMRNKLI